MQDKFLWLIDESYRFLDKDNNSFLNTLYDMNCILESIIYQDNTYSYEAYRSLLILNHNFRTFLNSNYLDSKSNLSFLSYQIKSYYAYGGNKDILPYLLNLDKYGDILRSVELRGKEQFVVRSFVRPFCGIPEELKNLCEVPDFYPKIGLNLIQKIYQKK